MRFLSIILVFVSTLASGQFTKEQLHQGVTTNIRPGLTPFKVGNQLDSMIHSFQLQLSGTGFVKANGTTITYDNSTYLTGNQTITISGDASGSGATSISATVTKINGTALSGLATGIL